MQPTKYIWMNGELVDWDKANVHVLTHALHYGSGAFEGIRAYKTANGPAVFRLREHIERLFYSGSALKMEIPFTVDQIVEAVVNLLRENGLEQGYIRPLVYYGYGVMGLNPKGAPVHLAIACWPWGAYLPHDTVDVKISKYCRIHPGSTVADAKLIGHYVNSIMSAQEVRGTKYHEAIFLDYQGNVAEGPGENIFLIKNGKLSTPSKGAILAGITRDSIIQMARSLGYEVTERVIKPNELYEAEEAFFTGTAAEVVAIRSIDDKVLPSGDEKGVITSKLKTLYLDTVYGRNDAFKKFLTYVQNK
jgi:branched-chain amino acid aminotransferase